MVLLYARFYKLYLTYYVTFHESSTTTLSNDFVRD